MPFVKAVTQLDYLAQSLDDFFQVKLLDRDPAFSHRLPAVYENSGFDWQSKFEPEFCKHFNGLMIKGGKEVRRIFCVSFPSTEVFDQILPLAESGDLIFSHHALDMRNGDPKGNYGEGFIPLAAKHLDQIFDKQLSIYSCHAPLDYHKEISTSKSMAHALSAKVTGSFLPYGNGDAGLFCEISPLSQEELESKLLTIFGIPYLDISGTRKDRISRIAVVAGVGGGVSNLALAEAWGADAYITGEIAPRIRNDFWDAQLPAIFEANSKSPMALLAVSHAASEFLIMKQDMKPWLEARFGLPVQVVGEEKWWR